MSGFCQYNMIKRNNPNHVRVRAPGVESGEQAYEKRVNGFATGLGDRPAVVTLEPDALAQLDKCLALRPGPGSFVAVWQERVEDSACPAIRRLLLYRARLLTVWRYAGRGDSLCGCVRFGRVHVGSMSAGRPG
jgi:hypothetical protein